VFERAARFHDLGILRDSLAAQLKDKPTLKPFAGSQFRMGELTGAVALAQLRKVDGVILDVTRRYHRHLRQELARTCPGIRFRDSGDLDGDAGIGLYLDLSTPEKGKWFAEALEGEGIPVGGTTRFCNLLSQEYVIAKRQAHPAMPPFGPGFSGAQLSYDRSMCPNTPGILDSMVAIMLAQSFTAEDLDDIRDAVSKVWNARENLRA
jgi:dTDP-4-amino-4,6-dideoxygalactose transaminase